MSGIGRPLTPDEEAAYHSHVGSAIRAWAHLEFTLMFYLQLLLHVDQWRARVVWHSLPNFRARFNLISKLAETFVTDDAVRVEFRALMKRMKALGRQRNSIAHTIGATVDGRNRIVLLVDSGDENGPFKFSERAFVQIGTIAKWRSEMDALRSEMGAFLGARLDETIGASPRKSRGEHPA